MTPFIYVTVNLEVQASGRRRQKNIFGSIKFPESQYYPTDIISNIASPAHWSTAAGRGAVGSMTDSFVGATHAGAGSGEAQGRLGPGSGQTVTECDKLRANSHKLLANSDKLRARSVKLRANSECGQSLTNCGERLLDMGWLARLAG